MSIHPQKQTSSAPVVFRCDVQSDDRDRVRAIVASTGVFSPVEIEVAVELLDERLEKGPSSGYHFIFAQRDNRTLGYACYGPIALTAASYDLYWIAVDKTCQGQKIGQLLLAKSEELIRQPEAGKSTSKPPTAPIMLPRENSIFAAAIARKHC